MKIRTGFVSNSSSSSFIIRKESFTENDLNKIKDFFKIREGSYETELIGEDDLYIWGDLEAHNIDSNYDDEKNYIGPNDKETANNLFCDMVEDMNVLTSKDVPSFVCRYEECVTPENLGDSNEGWTGETYED